MIRPSLQHDPADALGTNPAPETRAAGTFAVVGNAAVKLDDYALSERNR